MASLDCRRAWRREYRQVPYPEIRQRDGLIAAVPLFGCALDAGANPWIASKNQFLPVELDTAISEPVHQVHDAVNTCPRKVVTLSEASADSRMQDRVDCKVEHLRLFDWDHSKYVLVEQYPRVPARRGEFPHKIVQGRAVCHEL